MPAGRFVAPGVNPYLTLPQPDLATMAGLEVPERSMQTKQMADTGVTAIRTRVDPPPSAPPAAGRDVNAATGADAGPGMPLAANARMEAVGRLAAGAAHDFNNVLTAISGYAGLLADELPPSHPGQAHVTEIRKAAERAMRLTRELLAFGRRDVQERQMVGMNDVVNDVLPMLRQLVGDRIELVTNVGAPLPFVLADPGQFEQVVVNLVLNARDAMPDGGRVVVSTATVSLDHEFARTDPGARPGSFVRLPVSDRGTGMDAGVLAHIFEPYFTTKAPGRGTGLGLSTVFGIVKQSDGYVWAESAPGFGTTIMVDLPAAEPSVTEPRDAGG